MQAQQLEQATQPPALSHGLVKARLINLRNDLQKAKNEAELGISPDAERHKTQLLKATAPIFPLMAKRTLDDYITVSGDYKCMDGISDVLAKLDVMIENL